MLLEVFFGDGCVFFSHVDDIQFHFTKFSLEDRTIMLFANCVLTRVWSQALSLSYILLVSTFSICIWNLCYLPQLFCSVDVSFLVEVIEVT